LLKAPLMALPEVLPISVKLCAAEFKGNFGGHFYEGFGGVQSPDISDGVFRVRAAA
jgi:hypothetical protein